MILVSVLVTGHLPSENSVSLVKTNLILGLVCFFPVSVENLLWVSCLFGDGRGNRKRSMVLSQKYSEEAE